MPLLGSFLGSAARNIVGRALSNGIEDIFGGTQAKNNAYSFAEMRYANELEQSNARQANRIAQENASIAFERQKYLNDSVMAFNAEESAKARAYDERMSNTAYQRAMDDMKAAGLNPILAYSQGGAAVTGGQAASIGASTASQAQSYSAGVQRQDIDKTSTTELKKTGLQVVGNLFSTYINSASRVTRALASSLGRLSLGG